MATPALQDIQQDDLAMSVAKAVAIANETAAAQGVDLTQSLVTIAEEAPPPGRLWRIHYGPRDYKNRRGGDLIIFVDETSGDVQRTLRGQ